MLIWHDTRVLCLVRTARERLVPVSGQHAAVQQRSTATTLTNATPKHPPAARDERKQPPLTAVPGVHIEVVNRRRHHVATTPGHQQDHGKRPHITPEDLSRSPAAHCGIRFPQDLQARDRYRRGRLIEDPYLPNRRYRTACHTTSHSCYFMCCRILLYRIKHAASGGADVAKSVSLLACPPGRSRSLRAAWRPCSRGPAQRAGEGRRVARWRRRGRSSCCRLSVTDLNPPSWHHWPPRWLPRPGTFWPIV
jgi:hypothetical protein